MSLLDRLRADFEQFTFAPDEICHWSPAKNTIFYRDNDDIEVLHELGHALCGHQNFDQDVELLHMERDAWEKAREIAPRYNIEISDDTVESALDGYRDWLHQRSLCPNCGQNGIQNRKNSHYYCINCAHKWNSNDARQCGLQRKTIK